MIQGVIEGTDEKIVGEVLAWSGCLDLWEGNEEITSKCDYFNATCPSAFPP